MTRDEIFPTSGGVYCTLRHVLTITSLVVTGLVFAFGYWFAFGYYLAFGYVHCAV